MKMADYDIELSTKNESDFGPLVEDSVLIKDNNSKSLGGSDTAKAIKKEEPQVIKEWREAQVKILEQKDTEEDAAKLSLKAQAKKELEDWYQQHAEKLVKLQSSHRASSESAEKEYTASTHTINPGTEWERVAKLCDFNPKTVRNTKDVSRMRSVILQLKQSSNSHGMI